MTTESTADLVHVIDIGGSHITAAAVELANGMATITQTSGRDIDPHGPAEEILAGWADACRELGDIENTRWGIAMPDPFDFERGIGTFVNVAKFEHLANVDLRHELAQRLGTAPERVRFLHDAAAYGIGEWMFGEARGHNRAVCITLGTGVGSTFLDRGEPIAHRADVPTNGTVHLLQIDGAPLEDAVSTRAIIAAYERRTATSVEVKTIAERARAGEPDARVVLDGAMHALGAALGPWLAEFEASVLVAGGSISRSWDLLEQPFRAGIAEADPEFAVAIELRPSKLLDEAPLLGAATWLTRE
ncbi:MULTISPECIES: ROK family protein [Subtercola]|uniref:ROK family protein n=1 Tax=Subtercola vilae TaxID=2056433 RepID=A0A4T2BF80_9MICO|nr:MULTISPECIES: ROK family protein [Subtercola]MEA9987206.1 ROK family protein [Subtercola sp. RTI3]TIH27728.1 ROK family protein [Subtercola vilae]